MRDKKVDSEKDKLYFLSKYTTNKAQEVVKGFLTLDSNKGYEEARKLLAFEYPKLIRLNCEIGRRSSKEIAPVFKTSLIFLFVVKEPCSP